VTFEWRIPDVREIDHEALWSAVIVASAVSAAVVLHLAGLPPIGCVFKALSGLPCLTCGFGRGLLSLSHGDVLSAARWNPLVPLGAAAAAAYVTYAAFALLAGSKRLRARVTGREALVLRWAVVAVCAVIWGFLIADAR
jgi:hypothetical protein